MRRGAHPSLPQTVLLCAGIPQWTPTALHKQPRAGRRGRGHWEPGVRTDSRPAELPSPQTLPGHAA